MKNQIKIHGRGAQISLPNKFHSHHKEKFLEDFATESERKEYALLNPKTQILEIFPKTIVNKVESPDLPMEWSLNPYQGCEHGCIYCYARNSHEYWDLGVGIEFESKILVKKSAPDLLRKTFEKPSWKAKTIVMAGNTDIYQPIERKLQITRKLLKVFLEHHHPVGLITKNALILRDLDILKELAALNLVHVNLSLNTLDEHLKRVMEPRTSSVHSVLKAVSVLAANNIPVSIMAAPIVPGLNDSDIIPLVETVVSHGAQNVNWEVVRLNGQNGILFEDWVRKTFPDRADKVLNKIKSIHGGKLNDSRFGTRMRGEGEWAKIIKQQFHIAKSKYLKDQNYVPLNCDLFEMKRQSQFSLF